MTSATFTHGPTMRHIINMTVTGAIGLTALFFVDLLNMFFLSLLGQQELAAAVGFAGSLLFFTISICIGCSIAASALVGKSIGAGKGHESASYAINAMVFTIILSLIVVILMYQPLSAILSLLGAKGITHQYALSYSRIIMPSMPILAAAMVCAACLRALGDAKLSMYTTLFGGAINAIMDPILIFGLDLKIEGAAISSVLARIAMAGVALYGVFYKHNLRTTFDYVKFKKHLPIILSVAGPAILTNIATPFGNAYITYAIAQYGDSFVAGYSIIGRVIPVAFGLVFALSGAVGPIIAQNYGAGFFDRVKQVLKDALKFSTAYVVVMTLLLYFLQRQLVNIFQATGDAKDIVEMFCTWFSIFFIFNGYLFVANALFNNLGHPRYATFFNLGKATVGTIPFVYLGASLGNVWGIWWGISIGSLFFGVTAFFVANRLIDLKQHLARPEGLAMSTSVNPLSSGCAQLGQVVEEHEFDDLD